MEKKRGNSGIYILLGLALLFTAGLSAVFAINFGDPSPDGGEADNGTIVGTFGTTTGGYPDTWTENAIYFGIERANNGVAAANMTLAFNISVISSNTSVKIIGLNGSTRYCNTARVTNLCDGSGSTSNPSGTPEAMSIFVENATGARFLIAGTISATATNTLTQTNWSLAPNTNFYQFVNGSGFVNVYYEFKWAGGAGTGRSSFMNDQTNLTVIYDAKPKVTLNWKSK